MLSGGGENRAAGRATSAGVPSRTASAPLRTLCCRIPGRQGLSGAADEPVKGKTGERVSLEGI